MVQHRQWRGEIHLRLLFKGSKRGGADQESSHVVGLMRVRVDVLQAVAYRGQHHSKPVRMNNRGVMARTLYVPGEVMFCSL